MDRTAAAFHIYFRTMDIGVLVDEHYIEIISLFPAVIMMIGMLISVSIDPYIQKQNRRLMYIIGAVVISLIAQNYLDSLLTEGPPMILLRKIVDIYGYSIRPVILVLFIYIVSPGKKHTPEWILVGINGGIYLTALFSDICFTIDDLNQYQGGLPVLQNSCLIISIVLLTRLLYCLLVNFLPSKKMEIWIPGLAVMTIAVSLFIDGNVHNVLQPVSLLTIAISISCVLFYIYLHYQFIRNYQKALETQQRIQIMMTQIQPHFLYNTLAAIRGLCLKNPEQAARTIEQFSKYLRQNLNTVSQPALIPVSQEMEHVRIYTEIEMQMFPYLDIQYDLEDEDFLLPALTIQPIVENAIRHGIRGMEDGWIRITSRKEAGNHIVEIADNGPGFDPDAAYIAEGDHVGIRNIRERIEKLCAGTMKIDSAPGKGTVVIITIPELKDSEEMV